MPSISITEQKPIYGAVLSGSVYAAKDELPGIGRFLSQGAAAGAVLAFLFTLGALVRDWTNPYNFVFIFSLPIYLGAAMILSLFPSLLIWAGTRLDGHHLDLPVRVFISVVTMLLCAVVGYQFLPGRPAYLKQPELSDYLPMLAIGALLWAVLGVVIGSGLQPWRALVRGVESLPPNSCVPTGITGLLLRAPVVWGLMEAVVIMIYELQRDHGELERVVAIVMLAHFTLAIIIVFVRTRLWLLFPLALIANIPVGLLIEKNIKSEDAFLFGVAIAAIVYLSLWSAFLLSRWRATYTALASLKDELRYYYLID